MSARPDPTARARATDPGTSHQAAARVSPRDGLYAAILRDLEANGAASAHVIAERIGAALVSVSPCLKPLELAGLVCRAGLVRDEGARCARTRWAVSGGRA